MKIVYTREYEEQYPSNPIESPDRVRLAASELASYDFIEPSPASLKDISMVHGREHIERVKSKGFFRAASLAAGGAIKAAELAIDLEPAFALVRPPGHHASANRAWGMCYFNNMAIAIQKVRQKAKRVLIIDIDLHFGDGTVSIFRGDRDVKIVNPGCVDIDFDYLTMDSSGYLKQVESAFQGFDFDLVGVSAGFDAYVEDWGKLLSAEDYREIGNIIREGAEKCSGRRFAVLEGGYHADMRDTIKRFIKGFQ